MNTQNDCLSDGIYKCEATLHIKNNRAHVELNDTFGLKDGTKLPRSREEDYLLVKGGGSGFNGHTII